MPQSTLRSVATRNPALWIASRVEQGRNILGDFTIDDPDQLSAIHLDGARNNLRYERAAGSAGAWAWDAPTIQNGEYKVSVQGIGFTFSIYTVRGGQLAGKRIIKVLDPSGPGGWKGFAWLDREGNFLLWARFARQQNEMFVQAAQALVNGLNGENAEDYPGRVVGSTNTNVVRLESFYAACVICNQRVTALSPQLARLVCSSCLPAEVAEELPRGVRRSRRSPVANRVNINDPELQRLIDEEEQIERRTRREPDPVIVIGDFRIQRRNPLPLCEVSGTEIQ